MPESASGICGAEACLRSRWAWFVVLLSVFAPPISRGDVHVSPNGSDANPGTRAGPFATPERAREAVRALKRAGPLPSGGFTVWLHGGDYLRTNTLELTTADSGTARNPILWRAFGDERVRWLGGRRLTGFQPVTDPAVVSRLDPAARGHVLQLDLRANGIRESGKLSSRGFSRPTTPAHGELFFDGRPMTLARWPNEGRFEKIAGLPPASGGSDGHGGEIGEPERGFLYAGDRPSRWKDRSNVWVHGYWAWDWANSYERVAEFDLARHFIRTAPPHAVYGFRAGQRFQFLNILEELDEPGEWSIDTQSGVLYFWPPGDPSGVTNREALLSMLEEPLLFLNGASHLEFRGLVMEAARGMAVRILNGAGNRIDGCLIRNIGTWGVEIEGGSDNGVLRCDIADTGDGGVRVSGGNRQTLEPGRHFVDDCEFKRQGRWTKCYVPAIQLDGVGLRAAHNRIQDHPHCAILFWGNDHLIEFNDIHHVALETGDVGAIYTGRDYSFRGNRIRSNFIHETGGVGMGSMGVYMDDCVSGTEVSGNVFWKVHWAMFIGGGRDHRVENNLFVDCDPAIRVDGRGLDPSPVWRDMVDQTMRKSLAAMPATLYRTRYPAITTLDAYFGAPGGPAIQGTNFHGIPAANNRIAHNVVVGKWLALEWRASEAAVEIRDNWVGIDVPFRDRTHGDFRPGPGSRLAQLGFSKIAFDQIGPRPSPERRRLARLTHVSSP